MVSTGCHLLRLSRRDLFGCNDSYMHAGHIIDWALRDLFDCYDSYMHAGQIINWALRLSAACCLGA